MSLDWLLFVLCQVWADVKEKLLSSQFQIINPSGFAQESCWMKKHVHPSNPSVNHMTCVVRARGCQTTRPLCGLAGAVVCMHKALQTLSPFFLGVQTSSHHLKTWIPHSFPCSLTEVQVLVFYGCLLEK